jgi:predicted nucleotidyltransferase
MSFLEIIKKNQNMRRIFGERELVIIEKQLLGVRLKPSEKTRLSRDIRKKFEAIKDLMPFAAIFGLKHGLIIKEIINDAKEAILESKHFPFIKRIVLFGSAVENQLTMGSDIDIAVEFNKINSNEATKFRINAMGKVDKRIDIHVYNLLPEKIKKEIDEKGKVIYEQKN